MECNTVESGDRGLGLATCRGGEREWNFLSGDSALCPNPREGWACRVQVTKLEYVVLEPVYKIIRGGLSLLVW